jgi:putative PIN family toxin of toxin-antitoxin system
LTSATLDSSVYVRALHFGGPGALLIGHARAGRIRIDISDPIVDETMRVLRDKFSWDGYMVQEARRSLLSFSRRVSPTATVNIVKEDPEDDRILECAAEAKSDFIVTEDKDLLRVGRFGPAKIVTIREFVRLALTQGEIRRGE